MNKPDYSSWFLLSDLDGTLINSSDSVSDENKEAVRVFTENGGRFGIATGRTQFTLSSFTQGLSINAPCVLYNGAGVFDLHSGKWISQQRLNKKAALPIIDMALARFPLAVVELFTPDMLNILSAGKTDDPKIISDGMPHKYTTAEELASQDWLKVLFNAPAEYLAGPAEAALECETAKYFELFYSGDTYFEILHKGASKGSGLRSIARRPEFKGMRFAAIGDHDNDSYMLKEADLGIAVANASPLCRSAAGLIGKSNDENAVADAIYNIIPKFL